MDKILLKLIHNVNWEIEKLVVKLQKGEMSGEDVYLGLRGIQSQHLNYADQKDLATSLQEYEFDIGGKQ